MPILGLAIAAAFVGALVWVDTRGGGGGAAAVTPSGSGRASASPSASASPTADPAEADVKAAAEAWVRAYFETYRTGRSDRVDMLEVPDSQAQGESARPINDINATHKTFLATRFACDTVEVSIMGLVASAQISCAVDGADAAWPSLAPGTARTLNVHFVLSFQYLMNKWLVDTQR